MKYTQVIDKPRAIIMERDNMPGLWKVAFRKKVERELYTKRLWAKIVSRLFYL